MSDSRRCYFGESLQHHLSLSGLDHQATGPKYEQLINTYIKEVSSLTCSQIMEVAEHTSKSGRHETLHIVEYYAIRSDLSSAKAR